MPFNQGGDNAQASIGMYIDNTTHHMIHHGDNLLEELRRELDPKYTTHPGRRECLEKTRVGLLKKISTWFRDKEAGNVLFLLGGAGTGKTTIASTVAHTYRNQLGSEQYFVREKSEPDSIFRTIAFDLASQDPKVAKVMKAELDKPGIQLASPERYFEQLLHDPLHTVKDEERGERSYVLIVLDALDECGDRESRAQYIRLIKKLRTLPLRYRFLVTSRPESDLVSSGTLKGIQTIWVQDEPDSKNDILLFLRDELGNEGEIQRSLGPKWEKYVLTLSDAANGLFIWATTVVKLIKEKRGSMGKELKRIATTKSLSGSLDSLYESVFESSLHWDEEMKLDFANILSLIMFGKEPLSEEMINNLLNLEHGRAWSILSSLRSLIEFNPSQSDEPILYHASLSDYLTSESTRGKSWHINEDKQKGWIAYLCFDVMKKRLRFNICGLETSLRRNEDIPDLRSRVVEKIPVHLKYVCGNWALHLRDAALTDTLLLELEKFALNRLLFWLEVISLTHEKPGHVRARALDKWEEKRLSLSAVIDWLGDKHPRLVDFIQDADTQFKALSRPILECTPHIYMSFLPLMSQNSVVARHYAMNAKPGTLACLERVNERLPKACIECDIAHGNLCTIKYSSDGTRITLASSEGLCAWDAVTGNTLAVPVQEGWRNIKSFMFSENGERLVSRDKDNRIIVWDTTDGKIVQDQFEEPLYKVESVAISPDGEHITASTRLGKKEWKVKDGCLSMKFVRGCFRSFMYSPDGKKIAATMWDASVLIWDASSSKQPLTLQGLSTMAEFAHFSHDGSRIVSASNSEIMIWDTETSQLVCDPINRYVRLVCFSSNGNWITSVSDATVDMWDASSGDLAFRMCLSFPYFQRRYALYSIGSITHSPVSSGKSIDFATISWDGVIRIWSINEQSKQSTWRMNDSGWLDRDGDDLLIWIPEYLRHSLLFGPCIRTLNTCFSTKVHFSGYEGNRWAKCFIFIKGADITFNQLLPQKPPSLSFPPPSRSSVHERTAPYVVSSVGQFNFPHYYFSLAIIAVFISLFICHYYIY